MKVLNITELQEIHYFVKNMQFPVAIYICNDWQKIQLSYLKNNIKTGIKYNTYTLCRWCQNHDIIFQVVYPLSRVSIIKTPGTYFTYLKLKEKLKHNN